MSKIIKGPDVGQLSFKCPACLILHTVNESWEFNNDFEFPTFSPSILEQGYAKGIEGPFRCHSWITKGRIKFFSDCSHDKAGQQWFDLLEIIEE